MDALPITVILCYILCLAIGLTAVAVNIVYKSRRPSSKGTRKLRREGGQREEPAREEKTESRPVRKSLFGRGIHKRNVYSGEAPLKPESAANEVPLEAQETEEAEPSEGIEPLPRKKLNVIPFPTRNKAGKRIEPGEVRKQVQPKSAAPVESSEPRVASKADSVSHTTLSGAPRGQSAVTESKSGGKPPQEPAAGNTGGGERKRMNVIPKQVQPKSAAPVESSEPRAASKADSVSHTALSGAPRGQSAVTEPKSGEKPPQEPAAGNTSPTNIAEPAQIGKGSEAGTETKPGTEVNQADSEPPAATEDSDETDEGKTQKEKSGMGDLADLFATSASEFTEKNRLAEQVNDVDVNDILKEGLGLLGKVKKPDR